MRACTLLSCPFRGGIVRSLEGLKLAKDTSSVAGTTDTHQNTGGTKRNNATPDLSALQPLEIKSPDRYCPYLLSWLSYCLAFCKLRAESGESLLGRCDPFRRQALRVCPMGTVAVE